MTTNGTLPNYAESFFTDNLDLNSVKQFLELHPSCVNQFNSFHKSPLLLVLQNSTCSPDIVKLLLQYNSNINIRDSWDNPCLFFPLREEYDVEAILKVLLESGAEVNINDSNGRSILCLACKNGASKSVIKLLLDAKCPPNSCLLHPSLMFCALECPLVTLTEDLLELLITVGGDLNSVDTIGRSALCLALQSGRGAQAIELLLSKGGLLNACKMHESPLLCATSFPDGSFPMARLKANVIRLLLNKEAAMDKKGSSGTPLQSALLHRHYSFNAIKLMVNHPSFDANASDKTYGNLLHIAVNNSWCKPNVVRLLIERGVLVEESNPIGQNLMKTAYVRCPDYRVLQLLFAAGARIDELVVHRHNDISLLKFAFLEYFSNPSKSKLYRLKLLFKWSCLQNPYGDCPSENSKLLKFSLKCKTEMLHMHTQYLASNYTLWDFAKRHCFQNDLVTDCNSTIISYDLNQLLRVLSNNVFPIYFDTIVSKIGRVLMEAKLKEVAIYTLTNFAASSGTERRIVLPYDSVLHITRYLSDEGLMQLILAYFNH